MKKVFIFAFVFAAIGAHAQVAVYDALKLRKLKVGSRVDTPGSGRFCLPENDDVYKILKYYVSPADSSSKEKIKTSFEKNAFMFFCGSSQGGGSVTGGSGLLAGFMGTNITTIADGLAKFLVERTKEELSIAFFRQFKEDLKSDKYKDITILFPQTTALLELIDERIYQFSSYLTELREMFVSDMTNLHITFPLVLEQPKYDDFFRQRPQVRSLIKLGLYVPGELIIKKRHPADILDSMNVDELYPNIPQNDININGALKTLQIVSRSLRSVDAAGGRAWLDLDSTFAVIKDPVTFKIYLGLLYTQSASVNFKNNWTLKRVLDTVAVVGHKKQLDSLNRSIGDLCVQLHLFEKYRQNTRENERLRGEDSVYLYHYALYSASLNIFGKGIELLKACRFDIGLDFEKYMPTLKAAGDVYVYVKQQRFTPAVLSVVKIYDQWLEEVYDGANHNTKFAQFRGKLLKYGTFIAEVSNAKTSDEVKTIIEKTVLPVGSSSVKKYSYFNIALNAYLGGYYGVQKQATDAEKVNAGGVYAPVGVSFSWGIPRKNTSRSPWSVSLFASVIDIGALASYRFTNFKDTLASDVNIRLSQIVSPGGSIVLGLPKLPVSIGFGGSWMPLLTKVEQDAITTADKQRFRWQAFIAVDIPLLHFYNRPR
jgi:hypothetical protein